MSKLFEGLERIEEVREQLTESSFLADVFLGKPKFDLLFPPEESREARAVGEAYCSKIEVFLKANVDPQEIERTAKIPDSVLAGLFQLGVFGMKIPEKYGGLGFSHKNYGRVLTLIASWSNILALTVAVPQSIGIAMPILRFGNEEQRQKFLPEVARKEISAFALTEPNTGSDAANVQTEAVIDADGRNFKINGEKLWCTNGTIARYITLIACVPAKKVTDKTSVRWIPTHETETVDARLHTAFILDMHSPGVVVRQRCQFQGCRGIENAYMTFEDVQIPAENVIGEIGQGLKYALSILNIGRAVSVPAICLGMAKQAWQPTLDRTNSRITFNRPLGERQTQRIRVGQMATQLFAMEALCEQVWHMADQKNYDIRIEAAVAKIFCSEQTIQFLNHAQIIFGGMGYETAESKHSRGQPVFGMEQLVRDVTLYRIGEGATDILRPFVAREGLSYHLERIKVLFDNNLSFGGRIAEVFKLAVFYIPWYFSQWKRKPLPDRRELNNAKVREKFTYIEETSRALARRILYAMIFLRQRLRDDQGRQNRMESISEDMLAIAATALHAQILGKSSAWQLADAFFESSKLHIECLLKELLRNNDNKTAELGKSALAGQYTSLNHGVIRRGLTDYSAKSG